MLFPILLHQAPPMERKPWGRTEKWSACLGTPDRTPVRSSLASRQTRVGGVGIQYLAQPPIRDDALVFAVVCAAEAGKEFRILTETI